MRNADDREIVPGKGTGRMATEWVSDETMACAVTTGEQEEGKTGNPTEKKDLAIMDIPEVGRLGDEPEKNTAVEALDQADQEGVETDGSRRRRHHKIVVEPSDDEEDKEERPRAPLTEEEQPYKPTSTEGLLPRTESSNPSAHEHRKDTRPSSTAEEKEGKGDGRRAEEEIKALDPGTESGAER